MTERELEKKFGLDTPEYRERKKITQKIIREVFSHYIYVTPKTFKFLSNLGIAIPTKDLNKYSDKYLVSTKLFHYPNREFTNFYVDRKNASAIKQLIKDSPQFMFPGRNGTRYKDGKLTLNRVIFDFTNNKDRMILCEQLFSWGSGKQKVILLRNLDRLYEKNFSSNEKRYDFYRGKVRYLNEAILEATGHEKFVEIKNKESISINSAYNK